MSQFFFESCIVYVVIMSSMRMPPFERQKPPSCGASARKTAQSNGTTGSGHLWAIQTFPAKTPQLLQAEHTFLLLKTPICVA